jgi:hypothetical protein
MSGFWLTKFTRRPQNSEDALSGDLRSRCHCSQPASAVVRNYRALSSASVEELWGKVVNVADVSWHPLLASTDLPYGLVAKPGLIFQAVMRLIPIPVHVFVERVSPGEFLSIRILVIPGVEERVTYQVSSTVCGAFISCSITLRGYLSPLLWSLIRPHAARLAAALAQAAEGEASNPKDTVFDC